MLGTKAKPRQQKAKPRKAGAVDPALYYTLTEFLAVAGIGRTTIMRARDAGIEFPAEQIGRRKYIAGDRGVEFLRALAALGKEQSA